MESDCHQLGYCFDRILPDGSSESGRLPEWMEWFPAKNCAGSDHAAGFLCFCSLVPERTVTLELHGEFLFHSRSCVLRFQEVIYAVRTNVMF